MQKFQDTVTGMEWHFDDGVDVSGLPGVPGTLSVNIVPRPSLAHDWDGVGWVLNQQRADAAANVERLAELASLEAAQHDVVRAAVLHKPGMLSALGGVLQKIMGNVPEQTPMDRLAALDARMAELRALLP